MTPKAMTQPMLDEPEPAAATIRVGAGATEDTTASTAASSTSPRPGSRAARMAHPRVIEAITQVAAQHGVCIRPIPMRRTDLATGETVVIDLPCGATLEATCPACAKRTQRLRQQQCREGWHRDDEPAPEPEANPEQVAMLLLRADFEYLRTDCLARGRWEQVGELDEAIAEVEQLISAAGLRGRVTPNAGNDDGDQDDTDEQEGAGESGGRRVRSTKRRQDAPDLPRRKVSTRTVGQTYQGNEGKVYRPSMFLTLTLPSYGPVRPDGAPVDPKTYDYRRAAWDAIHFPALLDRLWQNLRRVQGWNIQYFGAVEPQRRLAPHAHFAARGSFARADIKRVVAATYHQVWWPSTATVAYPDDAAQPIWDDQTGGYVDPTTRQPLLTWAQALDAVDADEHAEPAHVVRFGTQLDIKGVLGGTPAAEKMIGYLTKYLTKSVDQCHQPDTVAAEAHQRRLWEELRHTPCSPRCANWLRYGIQPDQAKRKQRAGQCKGKAHRISTLGLGGRRVLVSRQWSNKTLADHRWDQALWVRKVLGVSLGHMADEDDDLAARVQAARVGGAPAPVAWEKASHRDRDVPDLTRRLLTAISTRIQHQAAIAKVKARAQAHAQDPATDVSADAGLSTGEG